LITLKTAKMFDTLRSVMDLGVFLRENC